MKMVGVDPGPKSSGVVVLGLEQEPLTFRELPSVLYSHAEVPVCRISEVLSRCEQGDILVIEWVSYYGRMVGASVFHTARVAGYWQALADQRRMSVRLVTRPEVARRLTGERRATNGQVRAAVRESYLYGRKPLGGGKRPEVGTMDDPGPLHGIRSHAWEAMATVLSEWEVIRAEKFRNERAR